MRELTFTIEFDRGIDPLTDRCIATPDLGADAVASCVRRDSAWIVERFVGPATALERIEQLLDADGPPVGVAMDVDDRTERNHDRLERSSTQLVVYTFLERLHTSNSIPALAARYLDLGHVFKRRRRGDRQEWRLLMRSDENVDVFYDALAEHSRDGVRIRLGRLGDVERWDVDSLSPVSLPMEQRDVLQAAVDRGYYETPREVTIADLAAALDVPESTVSYRLRQAEASLAKGFLHRPAGDEAPQVDSLQLSDE